MLIKPGLRARCRGCRLRTLNSFFKELKMQSFLKKLSSLRALRPEFLYEYIKKHYKIKVVPGGSYIILSNSYNNIFIKPPIKYKNLSLSYMSLSSFEVSLVVAGLKTFVNNYHFFLNNSLFLVYFKIVTGLQSKNSAAFLAE